MKPRIVALAVILSLLVVPIALPRAASAMDAVDAFDAVVVVTEADLPALLETGALGEYALVSAADLGLDEAALAGLEPAQVEALLTPGQQGRDLPTQVLVPPVVIRGPHVTLPPGLRHVRVLVLPPLLPPPPIVVRPLPPPPPPPVLLPRLPLPPPSAYPAVPIIPEAETGGLVLVGLLGLAGLVVWRRRPF